MKRWLSLALALVLLAVSSMTLFSCSFQDKVPDGYETTDEKTNYVLMTVENYGQILIELYPDVAPITVANFQKLVSEKFYDGLTFHRVYKGFMIQGGDPKGNGTGGSDETIKGEFSANGVDNPLSHTRGVISMARSNAYNSASSQFFICHEDSVFLDGNYAAFGKVIVGMDVVDKIADCEVTANGREVSKPVDPPAIESAVIITKKDIPQTNQ